MTLNPPSSSTTADRLKSELTAEELVAKLRRSLARDGDFPASAKAVNELRELALNPRTSAHQISEIILKEPSLGTRVLAMVNSAFYRRAKPIMTVSQAVIQIGMKPLAELCSGLILMRKFVPLARKEGPFAACLQTTMMTSLLASSFAIVKEQNVPSSKSEQGYLAGSFAELGALLLAYYFPRIFEAAAKRGKTKNISLEESIKQITGISPLDISIEVLQSLNLPDYYSQVLLATKALDGASSAETTDGNAKADINQAATIIFAAHKVSTAIASGCKKNEFDRLLQHVLAVSGLPEQVLGAGISRLPPLMNEYCAALEITLPALPEFINTYSPDGLYQEAQVTPEMEQDKFSRFVDEIRQAVENREPTASIVTSVMETLAWGLGFDRVLLMLLTNNRRRLMGRMILGKADNINPRDIERPLFPEANRFAPEARAFAEGRPIFNGDPIFSDGWPLAAIPVGFPPRAVGVIYADRTGGSEEVEMAEQAAIGLLAELLDRSILIHSERETRL